LHEYLHPANKRSIHNVLCAYHSKGMLINEMEALARAFPDASFLGIWSGNKSLLQSIVSATKPTFSIALDSGSGACCLQVAKPPASLSGVPSRPIAAVQLLTCQ
jgi:hypothetical protein